ncbi:hypothetical protein [Arcobacter vandammei]|uniref:hypothetical protein n=1 Tax=Arcobacter vandammei TaxID=2782243 RepID=UPI0018DF73B2|nr:hypothetical protein [Arcobacter vandammei]
MLVSGTSALNILLANNNKVLNDVLKEADIKTLETLVKDDPKAQTTATKVIKELFENIKDGSKSSTTIENILKNSTIFKELGNVSTNLANLSNLLEDVESRDSLAKFKPLIENLTKNIKDLDSTNLKEQIKNSGIFLENKLVNSETTKVENILKDIQSLIKNIETPISKQLNEQITKVLQDISNPKISQEAKAPIGTGITIPANGEAKTTQNVLQNQNISQTPQNQTKIETGNLTQTINEAKTPIGTATSVPTNTETKTPTQNFSIPNPTTTLTTNREIKSPIGTGTLVPANTETISNNPLINNLKNLTQNIQTLSESLSPKEFDNINKLTKELKNIVNQATLVESKIENNLTKQLKLETPIQNPISSQTQNQNTQTQPKEAQIQNLQQNILNAKAQQTPINQIQTPQTEVSNQNTQSKIQTTQAFLNQIQNQIKEPIAQNTTQTTQISNQTIAKNEAQILQSQAPQDLAQKIQITNDTKELIVQIKNDLINNPILNQNSRNILPIIDNLLKMENLFIKNETLQNMVDLKQINQNISQNNLSTFSNNFASNLSPLLSSLKENLNSFSNPNNLNIQNHLEKTVNKIEHIISNLEVEKDAKTSSKDDIKTILLQLKEELTTKTDAKSTEILKQVDKLLTQIDFHQLNSLVSNSNFVYVPFVWEMLEDGSINIKKAEEDKFYCQINLTLKDFGKVDLMLGLYDKNKMDLTIYAQRDHFKVAIRENIQELKIALNSVDIIPMNIKLLDMKENSEDTPTSNYINNIFNQNITSGIDIKA